MTLNSKNWMFEFTTYIPPGPTQFIFTNYPTEFHYDIKSMIIKPRTIDTKIKMRADLKVRKKKRKFCKESTLFSKIKDDKKNDYNACC